MEIDRATLLLSNIKQSIIAESKRLDIRYLEECDDELTRSLFQLRMLLEEKLLDELRTRKIKALDVFDKEFIVQPEDFVELQDNLGLIISLRLANTTIPLEDILKYSDLRFSVIYDGLDGLYEEGRPHIVDVPGDVFKFLIENNYDNDILKAMLTSEISANYNFVDIFKKLLQVGKGFSVKNKLLNGSDISVVEYIISKYNTETTSDMRKHLMSKMDISHYSKLIDKCKEHDICTNNVIYRIHSKNMTIKEAIELGIEERDKYKIDNTTGNKLRLSSNKRYLADVFYEVTREYMRENNIGA